LPLKTNSAISARDTGSVLAYYQGGRLVALSPIGISVRSPSSTRDGESWNWRRIRVSHRIAGQGGQTTWVAQALSPSL